MLFLRARTSYAESSRAYANASCHVEKIYVLICMQRTGEARRLHATANRVFNGQLEATERALRRLVAGGEKDALEIELESLQLSQRALTMYGEELEYLAGAGGFAAIGIQRCSDVVSATVS